jgi:EAL domain-containing protein (putative c-di-GMP-specific phosphodiesterase class I)
VLIEYGYQVGQGFLFARPMRGPEFIRLLAARARTRRA